MENMEQLNGHSDDMDNIIRINIEEENSEEFDYDFDYDPNEMYYELLREGE